MSEWWNAGQVQLRSCLPLISQDLTESSKRMWEMNWPKEIHDQIHARLLLVAVPAGCGTRKRKAVAGLMEASSWLSLGLFHMAGLIFVWRGRTSWDVLGLIDAMSSLGEFNTCSSLCQQRGTPESAKQQINGLHVVEVIIRWILGTSMIPTRFLHSVFLATDSFQPGGAERPIQSPQYIGPL